MLKPIEDTIRNRFIPAITGGHICNEEERKLLSLPTRFGGLAITIFHEQAEVGYKNSRRITTELTSLITVQQVEYTVDELAIKKMKLEIKNEKENTYKNIMEHLKDNMSEKPKRLLQLSTEKGVSNWLTVLPIAEYGLELSKQQFWDSISLRYEWEISKLPTACPCGSKFDIQHSMNCKKGGFVTIRHNDLRDFTAIILWEVCYDTEIEPRIVPLSGEDLSNRTANRSNEARLDVRARGFWERGKQAFFDLRVFDPNACR